MWVVVTRCLHCHRMTQLTDLLSNHVQLCPIFGKFALSTSAQFNQLYSTLIEDSGGLDVYVVYQSKPWLNKSEER